MGEKLIYPTIVTVLIDLFTTSRIQHTDSSDNPNFSTEAHNTNFAVSPTPYACAQPYRLRSGSHELISMAWPQAREFNTLTVQTIPISALKHTIPTLRYRQHLTHAHSHIACAVAATNSSAWHGPRREVSLTIIYAAVYC